MKKYICEKCECRLDPGEGRLCDECRKEEARAQRKMMAPSAAVHHQGMVLMEAGV